MGIKKPAFSAGFNKTTSKRIVLEFNLSFCSLGIFKHKGACNEH